MAFASAPFHPETMGFEGSAGLIFKWPPHILRFMSRVLVADEVSKEFDAALQAAGIDVVREEKISPQELTGRIAGFDGIVVRSRIKITREHIQAARELKIIGRAGAGVDNIDVPAAAARGIVVVNAPGANTQSVAEQVFALLLSFYRNIPRADASMKSGRWDRSKFMGFELCGKTMGVIGLGRIGMLVARYAKMFGMRVVANSPGALKNPERVRRISGAGIELMDLWDVLRQADVVTLHVPLNDTTRHMIGAEQLNAMKKSAVLINTSRGGVVDEKALYQALTGGRIAGACLDVYEKEPPAPDDPLVRLDNVIATPHLSASTYEAQTRAALDIAAEFVSFFKSGRVENAVKVLP